MAGPVPLPTTIKRFCVIRSPHVFKKSREHFELRTHNRLIDILEPSTKDNRLADQAERAGRRAYIDEDVAKRTMSVQALLGKKIGTTQYFDQTGRAVCVTALEVGPCTVTQVKSVERDGYSSAQIGFEEVKKRTQPLDGHLKPSGGLFRHLREVDIDDGGEVEVGQKLDVGLFEPGTEGRRHRQQQGTRVRRGSETAQFPWGPEDSRTVRPPSGARLHRGGQHPRARHQGPQDGRSHGERACHRAQPEGGRGGF